MACSFFRHSWFSLCNSAKAHQIQQSSMNLWRPQETGVLRHLLNPARWASSIGKEDKNKDSAEYRAWVSVASMWFGHFKPFAWLNKEGTFLGTWIPLAETPPATHRSSYNRCSMCWETHTQKTPPQDIECKKMGPRSWLYSGEVCDLKSHFATPASVSPRVEWEGCI